MIKLYEIYYVGGISKIMVKNFAGYWVILYIVFKLEIINFSRVFLLNLMVKMIIYDIDFKWFMKLCF